MKKLYYYTCTLYYEDIYIYIYIIFCVYVYDACVINKMLIYGWRYVVDFTKIHKQKITQRHIKIAIYTLAELSDWNSFRANQSHDHSES